MATAKPTDKELEARALAACWRRQAAGQRTGAKPDPGRIPTHAKHTTSGGLHYVRVFNDSGAIIDIYRCRPRGELKRLVRPPPRLRK